jgi:tRNA(Ile)-lysidine synthetase-like protein
MAQVTPEAAVAQIPAGRWAVGVSGGADSVALLSLLVDQPGLSLHVVHLDHQTRSGASGVDAAFVRALAQQWKLPVTIQRRSALEPEVRDLPSNRSARFRTIRMEFFRRAVAEQGLGGVLLAHHADDQAETIMQRLLRGSGPRGLRGMSARATVGGLLVLRPLLKVRQSALRQVLVDRKIQWREDESNRQLNQQRNRIRRLLEQRSRLTDGLLALGESGGQWCSFLAAHAPVLEESFAANLLADLPLPVAEHAARRWLVARCGSAKEVSPAAVERLITMATDAASGPRQQFAGGVTVRRRGGRISVKD